MHSHKIAFIIPSNNDEMAEEVSYYINDLIIPEGYCIDILVVKEATSMTEAYNYAMTQTDAKYKVYLHQDLFIVNKNFISDILNIFLNHKDVGMIGTCGCKKMPESGIWWDDPDCVGRTIEDKLSITYILEFKKVEKEYEEVMSIDGQIMITQYDIKWREDILKGWHFYDESQSLEFQKRGYKVVVPKQERPWFVHECGVQFNDGYNEQKEIFLKEYAEQLQQTT